MFLDLEPDCVLTYARATNVPVSGAALVVKQTVDGVILAVIRQDGFPNPAAPHLH